MFEPRNFRADQFRLISTQDYFMIEVFNRVELANVDSLGVPDVTGFFQKFGDPNTVVADVGPVVAVGWTRW